MMKNLGFKEETKRINAGINLANGYGYDRAKFTDTDMCGKNREPQREFPAYCVFRARAKLFITPTMNDVCHKDKMSVLYTITC